MRHFSDWSSIVFLALVLVLPLAYIWHHNRTAREIVEEVEDVANDVETRLDKVESEVESVVKAELPTSAFAEVVKKHYPAWARNDEALSYVRVDELLRDSNVRGDEAAALAAIHFYFTSHDRIIGKKQILVLSVKQHDLLASAEERQLEQRFQNYRNHLQALNRELFAEGAPTLHGISQGYVGDCYLLATVGSTLQTDPKLLRQIIRSRPDHSYEVIFRDGESIHVPPLSDGLIVLGSRAGTQGLWLNVLEVAYGEHRLRRSQKQEELPEDVLNGGWPRRVMGLFTGREGKFLWLRSPEVTDAELRALLHRGVQKKTLMVATTTKQGRYPPRIIQDHCYAVLGFDPTTDHVRIWNPWGASLNFRPSGPPGLEHGFAISAGVFDVPLRDVRHIFAGLSYE